MCSAAKKIILRRKQKQTLYNERVLTELIEMEKELTETIQDEIVELIP